MAAQMGARGHALNGDSDAAEQFGKLANSTDTLLNEDAKPLVNDLRKTVQAAEKSMNALNEALTEAKPGIHAFSKQTLPEVGQLVRDLRATSQSLRAVTERVEQQGAGSLVGGSKLPDYEPKK